jgi:two-component system sensor histidine kinase KdpD
VTFGVMLVVALVISAMTNRIREQAEAAHQRERRTAALLSLSRDLTAVRELDALLAAAARHVAELFHAQVVVLMPDGQKQLAIRLPRASSEPLSEKEWIVARWAFEHDEPSGLGTSRLFAAEGIYQPLIGSQGTVGVMGVYPVNRSEFAQAEQRRLLEAFANQSALAIERARLATETRAAWERVEAEFMRNTLLSSVSHDLRTPLAAITGAASSLVDAGATLPEETRRELAEMIGGESERMERLINNLLDMTRLESGGMQLRREWQPVSEVIGSALHHLDKRLAGREVKVNVPADLPLVKIDAVSMEQVLVNLLDNALQYTPPSSAIEVRATTAPDAVRVEILDRGPGLPTGSESRVFGKFFRAQPTGVDGGHRGIGLGLAICRGIVEAHGGKIGAENRGDGGARFWFTIPVEAGGPAEQASWAAEGVVEHG